MTIEKAIEKAIEILKRVDGMECKFEGYTTALGIAVQALEKQLPKKVLNLMLNADGKTTKVFKGICPCCQCIVMNEYCSRCGQALDWSDENE